MFKILTAFALCGFIVLTLRRLREISEQVCPCAQCGFSVGVTRKHISGFKRPKRDCSECGGSGMAGDDLIGYYECDCMVYYPEQFMCRECSQATNQAHDRKPIYH